MPSLIARALKRLEIYRGGTLCPPPPGSETKKSPGRIGLTEKRLFRNVICREYRLPGASVATVAVSLLRLIQLP